MEQGASSNANRGRERSEPSRRENHTTHCGAGETMTSSPRSNGKSSLAQTVSTWTNVLCALGLLASVGLTVYSHLGVTAEMFTNAPVDMAPSCESVNPALGDAALGNATQCNAADVAVWVAGGKDSMADTLRSCGRDVCLMASLAGPTCVSECVANT